MPFDYYQDIEVYFEFETVLKAMEVGRQEGVVGQQPVIEPGTTAADYVSGCSCRADMGMKVEIPDGAPMDRPL